jgi:hypothetical protein
VAGVAPVAGFGTDVAIGVWKIEPEVGFGATMAGWVGLMAGAEVAAGARVATPAGWLRFAAGPLNAAVGVEKRPGALLPLPELPVAGAAPLAPVLRGAAGAADLTGGVGVGGS